MIKYLNSCRWKLIVHARERNHRQYTLLVAYGPDAVSFRDRRVTGLLWGCALFVESPWRWLLWHLDTLWGSTYWLRRRVSREGA